MATNVKLRILWRLDPNLILTIIQPSPDPYLTLIISLQVIRSYMVTGGWVGQPITNPISGPSLDI